jgi:flavin-dependent dehydrogenase
MGPDKISFHIQTPKPFGYITNRDRFDAYLAEQAVGAGADFIDNCELSNLEIHPNVIRCLTTQGEYKGAYVVGADGATTKVGRIAGLQTPMKADEVGIALEVNAPIPNHAWETNVDPSMIYLWFLDIPYGYFWAFPRKHSLSFGVGGMASGLGNVPALLKGCIRLFQKRMGLSPLPLEKIRGHMLPAFPLRSKGFTGQRILLAGDAAGFVDTFTGQGICYAIESGIIAGYILRKTVKRQLTVLQLATQYEELIQRRFGRELLYGGHIALQVHSHRYAVFRTARHLQSTSKFVFDIASGNDNYDRIRRNPLRFLGKTIVNELKTRLSGRV